VLVLIALQSADESLVNLDGTAQLSQVFSARLTETVKNKPCGLLGDSNLFSQLHRRYSLASRDKQIHRVEPFVQRYVRPLEDSSSPHGEVQLAGVATVVAVLANGDSFH